MKRLMFVLALLFLVGFASAAQPTQQYGKILLSPQYSQSMASNTNTTFSLTLDVPDRMTSVVTAMVTFDLWMSPTVNYNLWVNGRTCNNPSYQISTTYSGAGRAAVTFECSNVINQTGTYNITLRGDKNTGAITAWVDLTYQNDPKGSLEVHGTEYTEGQTAKVWVQLINSSGVAVNNGVCYVDIYTPAGGIYIEKATMTNMLHDGIYYYDLEVPKNRGVYPAIVNCYYTASQTLSNSTSYNLLSGKLMGGTITDTNTLNLVYLTINTDKNGGLTPINRLNVTMNYSNFFSSCSGVSEALMTSISFYWNGVWNTGTANHDVLIYAYNYTSSSWVALGNKIVGGNGGATQTITNSITTNNITKALGITSTRQLQLRYTDTAVSEGAKAFKTDYVYASCDSLASPGWQSVKGSSELHVNSILGYLESTDAVSITNDTYYAGRVVVNFTISNLNSYDLTNEPLTYTGFHTLPCYAITNLYKDSNGSLVSLPFLTGVVHGTNECEILFNDNITGAGTNSYVAYANNEFEADIRSHYAGNNVTYPIISTACDIWRNYTNASAYVIPLNQTLSNANTFYRACNDWYDNYYWFNLTAQTLFNDKGEVVDSDTFHEYESDYYSAKFAGQKLDELSTDLINYATSSGLYSQAYLTNPLNRTDLGDVQYWANASTPQYNYRLLSVINVTTFTTNPTAIANAVWNYSGTITNNILTQFATAVWSATTRTLTAFGFFDYNTAALYVWNSTNRNLTYVNTTEIAEASWNNPSRNLTYIPTINASINESSLSDVVWNNTARYTHGVILN